MANASGVLASVTLEQWEQVRKEDAHIILALERGAIFAESYLAQERARPRLKPMTEPEYRRERI